LCSDDDLANHIISAKPKQAGEKAPDYRPDDTDQEIHQQVLLPAQDVRSKRAGDQTDNRKMIRLMISLPFLGARRPG
jgi:hypothetical protein